jgi:hypothetical protein
MELRLQPGLYRVQSDGLYLIIFQDENGKPLADTPIGFFRWTDMVRPWSERNSLPHIKGWAVGPDLSQLGDAAIIQVLPGQGDTAVINIAAQLNLDLASPGYTQGIQQKS